VGERVLDLGAGAGTLALKIFPRSLYWATDVNPLHLDELRSLQLTRPYLRVSFTDAERVDSFPRGETFDTALCVNVIEHLDDDIGALRNVRSVLRQGGCAIVVVPHEPRLYGSIDRLLGHRRRYRKEQLIAAGEEAGFRVREVFGFNRAASPAWWLNGKVLGRTNFGRLQIKMLNLLVPLFRRMDSWVPLPPLSLIAVFENGSSQAGEQTSSEIDPQTVPAPPTFPAFAPR
jgi:SAM-dependent methyltransferase